MTQNKRLAENIDYRFLDNGSDPDHYLVKLTSSKWKHVIYNYGKIVFTEDVKNDILNITFDYKVQFVPDGFSELQLNHDEEFKEHISHVLNSILHNEVWHIGKLLEN